ncbi:MAG TPA: hypothetical protein VGR21_10870, partial [Cryptosporangiaceae bacterium]|nr:hypothetical protein [Cryptosporangiaceae bacterium]
EGRGASGGEWAALGLLGLGFLVLAVVAGTGAHLAWTGGPVRRLATAALCTAVVCGWRVVGVLLRGFADLDGIDLGMLALFLAAGAILVLLRGRG